MTNKTWAPLDEIVALTHDKQYETLVDIVALVGALTGLEKEASRMIDVLDGIDSEYSVY